MEAMRNGAYDYLASRSSWSGSGADLGAREVPRQDRQPRAAEAAGEHVRYGDMMARKMARVYTIIEAVAPSRTSDHE
jgi:hypothetical protein